MDGPGNWSELYAHRKKVLAGHPSIWKLPVVKKGLDRLLANINDGARVLEVGAGDRRFVSERS